MKHHSLLIRLLLTLSISVSLLWVNSIQVGTYLVCALIISWFFDYVRLVSFRNFFLVYTVLLFVFSAWYQFPTHSSLALEGVLFAILFMTGYSLNYLIQGNRAAQPYPIQLTPTTSTATWAIWLFLLGKTFLLLNEIRTYGLSGYYSGQALADRIRNYADVSAGSSSVLGGLLAVVDGILGAGLIASIVVHVVRCISAGKRPNYMLLLLSLLGLPLIALDRSELMFGVVMLIFIFLADLRINRLRLNWIKYGLPAILLVLLATTLPSWIGILRENQLTTRGQENSFATRAVSMVAGELTPILFYGAVQTNIDELHYQFGNTIVLPFALKVVPRSWYPAKPLNSAGYVMSNVFPDLFNAGYSLAPSIYGDLYLNFGLWGTAFCMLLLGGWSRYLDYLYWRGAAKNLAVPLITAFFYYSILRNNLSDSFFFLLMSVVLYKVLRWLPSAIKPARQLEVS